MSLWESQPKSWKNARPYFVEAQRLKGRGLFANVDGGIVLEGQVDAEEQKQWMALGGGWHSSEFLSLETTWTSPQNFTTSPRPSHCFIMLSSASIGDTAIL